jgi:hypothetical protein
MKKYFVPSKDIVIHTVSYTKGISYRITKDILGILIDYERADVVTLYDLEVKKLVPAKIQDRVIGFDVVPTHTVSEGIVYKKQATRKSHKKVSYNEELP